MDVKFQQTYKLPSWDNPSVVNDDTIPNNAVGFKNTITASSVLNLKLGNSITPGKRPNIYEGDIIR